MEITNYLIETADECALIARQGRMLVERLNAMIGTKAAAPISQLTAPFSQLSDGGRDLSEQVDRIAKSLLAKAVEIDHDRQKKERFLS